MCLAKNQTYGKDLLKDNVSLPTRGFFDLTATKFVLYKVEKIFSGITSDNCNPFLM